MSMKPPEPVHDIPPERKTIYYIGVGMSLLGMLMFFSSFLVFLANFGNFNNFESTAKTTGFLAFGGLILIIVGGGVAGVGRSGLAGSGLMLDPRRARREREPWNRMAGGMANDTLSEMPILREIVGHRDSGEPIVKVRCRSCSALNDESANFCGQCGQKL